MRNKIDLAKKVYSSISTLRRSTRPVTSQYENDYEQESNEEDEELEGYEYEEDQEENMEDETSLVDKAYDVYSTVKGVVNGVQNAKKGAKVVKTAKTAGTLITFIKNYKLIIIGVVAVLIIVCLVLFITLLNSSNSNSKMGIGGYSYYKDACKQVMVNNNLIDIEDYVAGVVSREVPGFPPESVKAIAISARTYVIYRAEKVGTDPNSCYYNVTTTDDSFQVYTATEEDAYVSAAQETRGLIITRNGNLTTGHYDASCIYTAQAAKTLDPEGNYTDDNYYIKYGEWTLGGGIYFQEIPKEIAPNVGSFNVFFRENQPCYGNHGGGMSQNGSLYLEKYLGYNWEQIIDFYYNGEAEIMSIYPSYGGYSGEYPTDPNDELYKNLHFLAGTSLNSVLSSNGTTMEEFNANISSAVNSAGYGTREGSVAAAVTLVGSLAEMGYKINYQWGGQGVFYKGGSNWGVSGSTASCGSHSNPSKCYQIYRWQGFDCTGLVEWIINNGTGFASSFYSPGNVGTIKSLSSSEAICQPGDAIFNSGHITFVVGIDEENRKYIVAESQGYASYGIDPTTDSSNMGGVKLSYYGFTQSDSGGPYKCLDLSGIYQEQNQ